MDKPINRRPREEQYKGQCSSYGKAAPCRVITPAHTQHRLSEHTCANLNQEELSLWADGVAKALAMRHGFFMFLAGRPQKSVLLRETEIATVYKPFEQRKSAQHSRKRNLTPSSSACPPLFASFFKQLHQRGVAGGAPAAAHINI